MNRFLIVSVLALSVSCSNTNKETPEQAINTAPNTEIAAIYPATNPNNVWEGKDYTLHVNMIPASNGVYTLQLRMELYNGAHFISPNAVRDFKGKFTINIEDSEQLETRSKILETPLSIEELDPHPFVDGTVNWVRTNTTYTQDFKATTTDYFYVEGFATFTIEPACTLEKIRFFIKNNQGELYAEIARC